MRVSRHRNHALPFFYLISTRSSLWISPPAIRPDRHFPRPSQPAALRSRFGGCIGQQRNDISPFGPHLTPPAINALNPQSKGVLMSQNLHANLDTRMLAIAQRAAREGIGALSLGEALTAALVLDRNDWL